MTNPERKKNSGTWNVQIMLSTGSLLSACSWYIQKYMVCPHTTNNMARAFSLSMYSNRLSLIDQMNRLSMVS